MSRLACLCGYVVLAVAVSGCGGSGSGDNSGSGGTREPEPFCIVDDDCAGGVASECQESTCDVGRGVCVNSAVLDGTACQEGGGVCRDGFCSPTELKAFVKSPRPEPSALFGTSVSLLGDRMAVGAPSSGPPFGRVAIFERAEDVWSVVQELETPPPGRSCGDGLFGWDVAVAEETVFVSAMGLGLGGSGSIRIFIRPFDDWVQESFGTRRGCLRHLDPQSRDRFGASMDVTPDGETVVVGAPGHTSGELPISFFDRDYSGAIYIFEKINAVDWADYSLKSEDPFVYEPIKASNAGSSYECTVCEDIQCPTSGEGDAFGASVGISGDTIVVGAPGEASVATGVNGDEDDDSAPGAGAAYVFERIEGEWVQTAYLKASNTNEGDRFGFAVAIHGDTIVVGAEREDSGDVVNQGDNTAEQAGAAYVFERQGGVWEQTQYLKASNVASGNFFGATLVINETTLVVGSPGESSIGGENSGGAYVFALQNDEWVQTNFYKAFNADAGASFAGPVGNLEYSTPNSSVACRSPSALKGDSMTLDGDTLVVGAPYEDSAAIGVNGTPTNESIPDSGAVYVFDNSEGL